MVNRLIIAAAGSGKTTYLVRQAMQQSDSVLITTYTIANELEIRKKFVESLEKNIMVNMVRYIMQKRTIEIFISRME